jgi:hypothetical protein
VNADPALVLEGVTKTFVHGSARLAALSDIGFTKT